MHFADSFMRQGVWVKKKFSLLNTVWMKLEYDMYHYATSRKIAGSRPDDVDFSSLPNPSCRIVALGSTQPLNRNE
jgi:hypothetical protein